MAGSQMAQCPRCGHENDASAMNCSNCGINLKWALENWGQEAQLAAERAAQLEKRLKTAAARPLELKTWPDVWAAALTRPHIHTYEAIASAPGASVLVATIWFYLAYVLGYLLQSFIGLGLAAVGAVDVGDVAVTPLLLGGMSIAYILCAPVSAILFTLAFLIDITVTHAFARLLGGQGSYTKLIYSLTAIRAPALPVLFAISSIPVVNLAALFLGLYIIVLQVKAIRAVNGFGGGRAFLSLALAWLLELALGACFVLVLLRLVGLSLNDLLTAGELSSGSLPVWF